MSGHASHLAHFFATQTWEAVDDNFANVGDLQKGSAERGFPDLF